MVVDAKHMGGLRGNPRKRHSKANFADEAQALASRGAIGARQHRAKGLPLPGSQVPARPRGGLGGPPKRNWARTAALAMSALSELDPANRGNTMLMRDRFNQLDSRRAAAEEQRRRQAMIQKYTDGLSPEMAQLAQLAPDKFLESRMQQAFAQPEPRRTFEGADGFQYYEDGSRVLPNVEAPEPGLTPYQEAQLQLQRERLEYDKNRPRGNGITYQGPNGETFIIGGYGDGGALGSRGNALDASQLGDSLESASGTDQAYSLLTQFEDEMNKGTVNTGGLNKITTSVSNVLNDIPIIGAAVDDKRLASSQKMRSYNNQLAAAMLEMFGGSDTEKELAISVASNVGPDLQEETNRQMIGPAKRFVETQRRKPEFRAQWIQAHGGVDRIDPNTGMGMQASWDRYLQEQYSALFGGVSAASTEPINEVSGFSDAEQMELDYYDALDAGTFSGTFDQYKLQNRRAK
jgi:hypothetical protein